MVKVIDRVHIVTPHMPAPGFAQLCDACLEHAEGFGPGGSSLLGQDMAYGTDLDGCPTMALPGQADEIGPHECLITADGQLLSE